MSKSLKYLQNKDRFQKILNKEFEILKYKYSKFSDLIQFVCIKV
jgi:hypothetical protein